MRHLLKLVVLLLSLRLNGQIITTVAGNGTFGYSGDGGMATAAELLPGGISFDKSGNLYVTDNAAIRKISTSGLISSIIGNGIYGSTGDGGPATAGQTELPQDIVIDSVGNIFFPEIFRCRVRKISITGIVSTVVGNGTCGYNGDGGAATAATISNPSALAFDKHGNLYISDGNSRIRKVSQNGIISTVVGNGNVGFSGNGGPATDAMIDVPKGISFDESENLYFSDMQNNVIRKVSPSGIISTWAGTGFYGNTGDNGDATAADLQAWHLVWDKFGNLFFSDYNHNVIRYINSSNHIYTLAGNGIAGFGGDNGPASSAEFNGPYGITLDTCGNVYISDGHNYRVRRVVYTRCNYLKTIGIEKTKEIIYPNPVTEVLRVDKAEKGSYDIFNLVGEPELAGELKEGENDIYLKSLSTGMYILVLTDEEGKRTITKIVKE